MRGQPVHNTDELDSLLDECDDIEATIAAEREMSRPPLPIRRMVVADEPLGCPFDTRTCLYTGVYRVAVSVAIVLTGCACAGGRPPAADSTMASTITPIAAAISTDPASPSTTAALATTTDAIVSGRVTTTSASVTQAPRAVQPVPPLPADLVAQPSLLPSDPVVIASDEPSAEDATASDETVAIGWVVEMTTHRADESIEDRRERLAVYIDAASLTDGPLPFDLQASATKAMWPTGAIVSSAAGGIVVVEVCLNEIPESGPRAAPNLLTTEVTIADGRVIGWKVLP